RPARERGRERRAHTQDGVGGAVDVEEAPHARDASRDPVGGLVRITAGLAPGPERGADAELLLQRLMLVEVAVGGIGRARRIAAPLADQDRGAAVAGRLVARLLEGGRVERP